MFELSQLELLSAVARTGSYSGAARELHLTQPAVTYQMHRLERSVGTPLAVRVGRTMRLTSVGDLMHEHAERVLAEVRAAERQMTAAIDVGAATVRIAAFPSTCATVVPAALARLRHTHPELKVEVVQGEAPDVHAMVVAGRADIGLTYFFAPRTQAQKSPELSGRLNRVPLGVDDIRLLLPAQHPAAAHSRVSIGEVAGDTFLLASQGFEQMLTDLCSGADVPRPQSVEVADDYVAMQAFVAYRHGVALVPDLALEAHRDERVVARTLVGWPARHVGAEMWPDQMRVPAITTAVRALSVAMPAAARR